MPVNVKWYDEQQRVIWYAYEGRWTWDEFYQTFEQGNQMIESVEHNVDTIIDLRRSSLLPSNVMSRGNFMGSKLHPRHGKTVVVGANSFVQLLYDMFRKLYGGTADKMHLTFVQTLDEALLAVNSAERS
ncbi:MAG: hypothetical protein U0694_18525 [Anaerolineae bacterium]